MTWGAYLTLILNHYRNEPDDFKLSLGHWSHDYVIGSSELPEFYAYLCMELGELRKLEKEMNGALK